VVGFLAKRKVRPRGPKNPRREMTFLEHLGELRGRLIICVAGIVLTTVVGGIVLAKPVLDLLTFPFTRIEVKPQEEEKVLAIRINEDGTLRVANMDVVTSGIIASGWIKFVPPGEGEPVFVGPRAQQSFLARTPFAAFLVWIKVAFILGIVFALPIWLHQIWLFTAPAMTTAERRVVRPVILAGVFLFPMGVTFAYGMLYVVMGFALRYTQSFSGIHLWPDIQSYLSFALHFMLTFGLVFETPLVILLLVRTGVVSTPTLRKTRPYAVVIICILSAVLTPQDPFSMVAMALPMLVLYEVSLWVATAVERKIQAADRELEKAY